MQEPSDADAKRAGEPLSTASGGNFERGEVIRKGVISMGSERPENCPVDSFQWRTGGSPGKGVTTIEDADGIITEVLDAGSTGLGNTYF